MHEKLQPNALLSDLGPFAQAMINYGYFRRADNWKFPDQNVGKEPLLKWQYKDLDLEVFQSLADYLWTTLASQPDLAKLSEAQLANISQRCLQSPIFTAMQSPSIRLTQRHSGTLPFDHTINVLKELDLSGIASFEDKFLIILAAIYHDAAKCMAVGLGTKDDIKLVMAKFGAEESCPLVDSYRNHPSLSAVIFLELIRMWQAKPEATSAAFGQFLAESANQESVVFMIRYHHFHQAYSEGRMTAHEFVRVVMESVKDNDQLFEMFEVLCRADLLSVANEQNGEWLKDMEKIKGEILIGWKTR